METEPPLQNTTTPMIKGLSPQKKFKTPANHQPYQSTNFYLKKNHRNDGTTYHNLHIPVATARSTISNGTTINQTLSGGGGGGQQDMLSNVQPSQLENVQDRVPSVTNQRRSTVFALQQNPHFDRGLMNPYFAGTQFGGFPQQALPSLIPESASYPSSHMVSGINMLKSAISPATHRGHSTHKQIAAPGKYMQGNNTAYFAQKQIVRVPNLRLQSLGNSKQRLLSNEMINPSIFGRGILDTSMLGMSPQIESSGVGYIDWKKSPLRKSNQILAGGGNNLWLTQKKTSGNKLVGGRDMQTSTSQNPAMSSTGGQSMNKSARAPSTMYGVHQNPQFLPSQHQQQLQSFTSQQVIQDNTTPEDTHQVEDDNTSDGKVGGVVGTGASTYTLDDEQTMQAIQYHNRLIKLQEVMLQQQMMNMDPNQYAHFLQQSMESIDYNNATGGGVIETGEAFMQRKRETSEQAHKIMQKKGDMLRTLTTQLKMQRMANESVLINNIETMKSIQSPERMFRQNYTPIMQYQSLQYDLDNTYKAHRPIEKGFDQLIPRITKGENVFKKGIFPPQNYKKQHNQSLMDSTFMTSILKPVPNDTTNELANQSPLPSLSQLSPDQSQLFPPPSVKNRNSSKQQISSSKSTLITHDSSKKDPFRRSYLVPVYPAGEVINSDGEGHYPTSCMLDVNGWRKKYFLWGGKQKEHLDSESLIKLQSEFFEQVVVEILEYCSEQLGEKKLTYNHLFTNKGIKINNIIELPEDVEYLLASQKDTFKDVKFREVQIDTNQENQKSIQRKFQNFTQQIRASRDQTAETVIDGGFPLTGISLDEAPFQTPLTTRKSPHNPFLSHSAAHKPGFLNRHLKLKHPALLSPIRQRRFSKQKMRKTSILLQDEDLQRTMTIERESENMLDNEDELDAEGNEHQEKIDKYLDTDSKNSKPISNEVQPTKMLSQALLQRREWSKTFNLSNKVLFDLFSEFQSMMSLAKNESPETETSYDKNPFKDVLPVEAAAKMSTLHKGKMLANLSNLAQEQKFAAQSLHPNGLDIPLGIFKKYCKTLKSTKPTLVDKIIQSLGVEIEAPKPRVSWEIFLQLNCLLNFFSSTKDQYIDFFAGIFDPYTRGIVAKADYEYSVECLFKDQFSDGFEDEKNSLSADVKRVFLENGIVDENGDLHMGRLRRGLRDGVVDIEVFKQALK